MQEEREENKDLRTKTEPQEGDDGSVDTNGLRQNKRSYAWDSEHKVDVNEPRLTRSMTERKRQRSDSKGDT